MADEIKLSVCMIAYNQAQYIAQSVESALQQQTDFPFEIVIAEDCSTDDTRAILMDLQARHPTRIRLLSRERNLGMNTNFADAFAQCRGQYVALLEADDYWTDPSKLQLQVDALDANPRWTVCFHTTRCVYADGSRPDCLFPENLAGDCFTLQDILRRNFIQTCSAVYRGGVITKIPPWFFELRLGDWPLHILHAAHGDIGFLPNAMAVYRIHSQGVWSLTSEVVRRRATLQMLAKVDEHFHGRYHRQLVATRVRVHAGLLVARCHTALAAPVRRVRAAVSRLSRLGR